MKRIEECRNLSNKIRKDVLKMTYTKKAGFIGSAFSCADILGVLYGTIINFDIDNPNASENDTVILSKGHAASAWYASLANIGLFERERLFEEFNTSGFKMGVHPKRNTLPGIITSSGSLGQGCGQACGVALANKIQNYKSRVYVILGDGECNEGSNWEAFMLASRYHLNNLTVIIDRNRLQSYAHDIQVLNMNDMEEKLKSFGFKTFSVDGHNHKELIEAFELSRETEDRPVAIIANTVKGKGFKEFEDKVIWHYKWPEDKDYEEALRELDNQ